MSTTKPDISIIFAESGVTVKPLDAKIQAGYVSEVPVDNEENWAQNRSGLFLQHVDGQGVADWAALSIYTLGGFCFYTGQLWQSLTLNNSGNIPDDVSGFWESWQPLDKLRGGEVESDIIFGNNISLQSKDKYNGFIEDILQVNPDDSVDIGRKQAVLISSDKTRFFQGSSEAFFIRYTGSSPREVVFIKTPSTQLKPTLPTHLIRKRDYNGAGYASPQISLVQNSQNILTHGLILDILRISVTLVCIIAEGGYSVGAEVILNNSDNSIGSTSGIGISVYIPASDTSTLVVIQSNTASSARIIMGDGSTNIFSVTRNNWRMIIKAWDIV